MTRYKKVNYKNIAWMIRMAVIKQGNDMRLLDVVASLQSHTGLCLDVKRIQNLLKSRCVEKVEQDGDVRKVSTWVVLKT
jgi:hypothetical protein